MIELALPTFQSRTQVCRFVVEISSAMVPAQAGSAQTENPTLPLVSLHTKMRFIFNNIFYVEQRKCLNFLLSIKFINEYYKILEKLQSYFR